MTRELKWNRLGGELDLLDAPGAGLIIRVDFSPANASRGNPVRSLEVEVLFLFREDISVTHDRELPCLLA